MTVGAGAWIEVVALEDLVKKEVICRWDGSLPTPAYCLFVRGADIVYVCAMLPFGVWIMWQNLAWWSLCDLVTRDDRQNILGKQLDGDIINRICILVSDSWCAFWWFKDANGSKKWVLALSDCGLQSWWLFAGQRFGAKDGVPGPNAPMSGTSRNEVWGLLEQRERGASVACG